MQTETNTRPNGTLTTLYFLRRLQGMTAKDAFFWAKQEMLARA